MSQLTKLSKAAKSRSVKILGADSSPIVIAEEEHLNLSYVDNLFIQAQLDWVRDTSPICICVKGRRVGMTFAESFRAVRDCFLDVQDTTFSSYNLQASKEFIRDCTKWCQALNAFTKKIYGVQIIDEREFLSYSIQFPNGRRILAVSSDPDSFRGKKGAMVRDEASFGLDNLDELMKSIRATIMRGDGCVRLISTLNGINNKYTTLWKNYENNPHLGSVHFAPFDLAVDQGMYRSMMLCQGKVYKKVEEKVWFDSIVELYGSDSEEELFCIPATYSGNSIFREQWFQYDDTPLEELALVQQCQYFDLACTSEKRVIDEKKKTAYFTAQVTIAITEDYKIIITKADSVLMSASDSDDWIEGKIQESDYSCLPIIEKEPGSTGDKYISYMRERIQDSCSKDIAEYVPSKSKLRRALPIVPLLKNKRDDRFTLYVHESLKDYNICSLTQSKRIGIAKPTLVSLLCQFQEEPKPLVTDICDCLSGAIDYAMNNLLRGF